MAESEIERTVLRQIEKTHDVVVRISHARCAGIEWLDIRDFVISTQTYQRGVALPLHEVRGAKQARVLPPPDPKFSQPLHCVRCGRLLGHIERKTPVRAQCDDVECVTTQPGTVREERDSVVELMAMIGLSAEEIGGHFGISRQAVNQRLQ